MKIQKIIHKTRNSSCFKKTDKLLAFTLVELIVVIVILAILATITFLSFDNYSSNTRDSKKMSNITLMAKGFELNIAGGKIINTSETSSSPNIILSGNNIGYVGYYDNPKQRLLQSIGIWGGDLSQSEMSQNYRFTYIPSVHKYQVSGILENPLKTYEESNNNFDWNLVFKDNIFAESGSGYIFIKGNYVATGGILGLIPKQDIWDITINTGSGKIIDGYNTLTNGNTSVPIIQPINVGIFDATGSTGKFDSCVFGI